MSAPQIPGLRRELRFWETIALSIGIMAPTAAMALNGVGVAANVGRAVPLLFIVATIGVFLVSYGFVRLSAHYAHAGSVYAFSGATLGPQAGFFAGWALLGTYLAFTAASASEIGLFFGAFLDGTGIWHDPEWVVIALVAAVFIGLLAYSDIKITTRALLSMEAISVTLIIDPDGRHLRQADRRRRAGSRRHLERRVLAAGGRRDGGRSASPSCSRSSRSPASRAPRRWARRRRNPKREIPRAIRNAVLAAGIFYIICMLAQTWGFGTDAAGVAAFAGSGSPLGDLGTSYIGSSMGDAINLGAAVSAFAELARHGHRRLAHPLRDGPRRLRPAAAWARPRSARARRRPRSSS